MSLPSAESFDAAAVGAVGDHAVVIGAGMGGLVAARVLSDGFDRVTILERDKLSNEPRPRRGVPQADHVHVLLEAGRLTFEKLFPGYGDRVRKRGGVLIDSGHDFRYFHHGAFLADPPGRLPMLCASRPLFEYVMRERVCNIENVGLRSSCNFTDYIVSDGTIDGVVVQHRGDGEDHIAADLVVDASGRASRTPTWLADHGYTSPALEEVTIDLACSSTAVDQPPAHRDGYLVAPSPSTPRGGTVVPIEHDRWMVTLFGVHGDHPPTDPQGFREYAETLPTPEVGQLLEDASLSATGIHPYPFPSNRWYRYDQLPDFPDGLLLIGDAIASFNPIYGQGMSVSALEGLELHHTLASSDRSNLSTTFFDQVAETIQLIWRMTVSADFQFPATTGPKPFGTALFNWYLTRLIRTAHDDGVATESFARALRLETGPTSLVRPQTLARVISPSWLPYP